MLNVFYISRQIQFKIRHSKQYLILFSILNQYIRSYVTSKVFANEKKMCKDGEILSGSKRANFPHFLSLCITPVHDYIADMSPLPHTRYPETINATDNNKYC